MRLLVSLSLLVVALAGCMATPAEREARDPSLDPTQACRAQCNRENAICTDQRSAGRGGDVPFGMGATCQNELQSCLNRCGVSR